MEGILTPEEKKYLRQSCRYLSSLGLDNAIVEFDIDSYYGPDVDAFLWSSITHFSNNYSVEIPKGLIPIFKKILNYVNEEKLINRPDAQDINYERLEIEIGVKEQEINLSHYWSYFSQGDTLSTSWSIKEDPDDESIKEIFGGILDEVSSDEELELRFNGSGDSGYIENNFENGDSVPPDIEDWCYRQLENLHGGWEINEGSQGNFIFNLTNQSIDLYFTYNIEENDVDTIFEENFAN